MNSTLSKNPNHPKKGDAIKVQPIRSRSAIALIKENLRHDARNLCLFTLGVNTAYRASELLSLKIKQVDYLAVGDILDIKQRKTGRYRAVSINRTAHAALQNWLAQHPKRHDPDAPLFMSRHYRHKALGVPAVNRLVKKWCAEAGLRENYGSHTLRKTWGYHQRVHNKTPISLLMKAFGHKRESVTLNYLCILNDEIIQLYFEYEL